MKSDIEIAQAASLKPITQVAARLKIDEDRLELYGRYKAKATPVLIAERSTQPDGKLILVTAISPTPPGEGKTTTTIGLSDALNRIGKRTIACLREPSIGPTFGMKGGATGGGRAQVAPMEDINFHFTGDFHAIQLAHNLLAALIDNHLHHANTLNIDPRRITWKRVLDMNDRALRETVVGLGGTGNGIPRESGFDIVVASEVMAILCLADSFADLKQRLAKIVIGYTVDQKPVTAKDLQAQGAMAALLKDAFMPNLVQTLENNPALIHGGPFANIAHGCNSLVATRLALKLGEYVITEAGFGADLGAEKFMNIKVRKGRLKPQGAVIVATLRALKYHGGVDAKNVDAPNAQALLAGLPNLERHLKNIRESYGLSCVVALNHFATDIPEEIELLCRAVEKLGVEVIVSRHWAEGGAGAEDLARAVVRMTETPLTAPVPLYPDELPLWDKIKTVATRIYGASDISADHRVKEQLKRYQDAGYGSFPVCIAKTQYSFSTDAQKRGAPSGHVLGIREVRLAAGAEFVVVVCGDIMTMPGLPKIPAAHRIDVDDSGKVLGLS